MGLVVEPLTQNWIGVSLCQTNLEIQIVQVSGIAVCRNTPPQRAWEYVEVVTWPQSLTPVHWVDQRVERRFANTFAVVRDWVYRCQTQASMRWTCCYRGGDARSAHSYFLSAGLVTATEPCSGGTVADNVWVMAGAFAVGQTWVEGEHDRDDLEKGPLAQ